MAAGFLVWVLRMGARVEREMNEALQRATAHEATVLAWTKLPSHTQLSNPKPPRVKVHLRIHSSDGDYDSDNIWTLTGGNNPLVEGARIAVAIDGKRPTIAFPRLSGVTYALDDFELARQQAAAERAGSH